MQYFVTSTILFRCSNHILFASYTYGNQIKSIKIEIVSFATIQRVCNDKNITT